MEIYSAILNVMSDVGAIGKDKKNAQQGFKYRGVDDVMNALQPAMVKHGIFAVPYIVDHKREERTTGRGGTLLYSICTVKYTFYAKDGSSVEAVVIGEGMDSGDKATNKALSAAFKYACFQTFCIPTEEMKDPDAETPPKSQKKEREHITPEQFEELKTTARNAGYNTESKFYKFTGITLRDAERMSPDEFAYIMRKFDNATTLQEC